MRYRHSSALQHTRLKLAGGLGLLVVALEGAAGQIEIGQGVGEASGDLLAPLERAAQVPMAVSDTMAKAAEKRDRCW